MASAVGARRGSTNLRALADLSNCDRSFATIGRVVVTVHDRLSFTENVNILDRTDVSGSIFIGIIVCGRTGSIGQYCISVHYAAVATLKVVKSLSGRSINDCCFTGTGIDLIDTTHIIEGKVCTRNVVSCTDFVYHRRCSHRLLIDGLGRVVVQSTGGGTVRHAACKDIQTV